MNKFWTVIENTNDRLLVRARTGKQHWIDLDDPALRAPAWWEQFRYRGRFPEVDDTGSGPGERSREAANQS